jgi:hypothetical protein
MVNKIESIKENTVNNQNYIKIDYNSDTDNDSDYDNNYYNEFITTNGKTNEDAYILKEVMLNNGIRVKKWCKQN